MLRYPDLTPEKWQARLAALYAGVAAAYKPADDPKERVENLSGVFFGRLGFRADARFCAPENSFLNVVLDTKRGTPLALGVLYLLAGNHLGLPLYGVNLPTLFILTYKTPTTQFYVNVLEEGAIFPKSDVEDYVNALNLPPSDGFFQPCPAPDVVTRVLRNLIFTYDQLGEAPKETTPKPSSPH
jgi:regulator of sirC expression with transglutaminase-like and TPR domain